ncbi:MAG: type 2 isopentenyl-diphosphate Delta-isomerase, partial [Cyanobacteria bacterium P01_D01_bin.36]
MSPSTPASSPTNLNRASLPEPTLANPAFSPTHSQVSAEAALETQVRKADHLRICLDEDVQSHRITNGFEGYRFTHCCLPELNR